MFFAADHGIRALVFDLDGTLYVCERFAALIQEAAVAYLSGVRGEAPDITRSIMAAARIRLADESGLVPTLSAVCTTLGGSVPALHACFEQNLTPEAYLKRDERVVELLQRLGARFDLYLYTNNNRVLTTRIIQLLGVGGLFSGTFTIDDDWRGKPDETRLGQILDGIGHEPPQVLFVGDRYDVDLRLPEQKGCPIFLSRTVEQLLLLDGLLG